MAAAVRMRRWAGAAVIAIVAVMAVMAIESVVAVGAMALRMAWRAAAVVRLSLGQCGAQAHGQGDGCGHDGSGPTGHDDPLSKT